MLFLGEKEVDIHLLIIMSNIIFINFSKPIYKKNYKNFKRNRFNSDNGISRYQNNNRQFQRENQEIEIDISNLKYPINSKLFFYFKIKFSKI